MAQVTWYFDFVSPYAYFGLQRLGELPRGTQVTLQPILFGAVLNHWGQKGPAEVPTKRTWTYRACIWQARQRGWPFRMPAAHPFNPLAYLRLSIAAGNTHAAVSEIFKEMWTTGVNPAEPHIVEDLARKLDVPMSRLADADVKDALRVATERAIALGIFGVPTFVVGEQLFWGSDVADFVSAYLAEPSLLSSDEMLGAASLPVGAQRR